MIHYSASAIQKGEFPIPGIMAIRTPIDDQISCNWSQLILQLARHHTGFSGENFVRRVESGQNFDPRVPL